MLYEKEPKHVMDNVSTLLDIIRDGHAGLDSHTKRPILLMVSGGTDSALLPRIFKMAELDCPLHVFHVNYGLRGKDSDGDEEQVVADCNRLGISHTVHKVSNMSKRNMECEARDIRYNFVKKNFEDYIKVTAHHLEDQVETVLVRIMRGCSVYGYSGIDELRKDLVWRPFLKVPKDIISEATKELGIIPRIDMTNYDEAITRNWVRHSYVPELDDGMADSLIGLSESCKALRDLVDRISLPLFDNVSVRSGHISIDYKHINRGLLEDPLISKRLRDRVWNTAGFKPPNDVSYESLLKMMYTRKKGKVTLGKDQNATWKDGTLYISA